MDARQNWQNDRRNKNTDSIILFHFVHYELKRLNSSTNITNMAADVYDCQFYVYLLAPLGENGM